MFKKLLHLALLYSRQFRENRLIKKNEKEKKQQLIKLLKASRLLTKE